MSSKYAPMSERYTPGQDYSFSPALNEMYAFGNAISSPAYHSPSPQYMSSPQYGIAAKLGSVQYGSPLLSPAMGLTSPVYRAVHGGHSGIPSAISPAYQPNIRPGNYSPYHQQISPAYNEKSASLAAVMANKISPAYSPSALVHSPAYTASMPGNSVSNSGAKA